MQVPGYTVRLARRAEVAALVDMERDVYRALETLGTASPRPLPGLVTANDDGRLWVSLDAGGTLVGFALVREVGLFAHVDALAVLPAHARQGLGAALLDAVIEWAYPRGFSAVTISARSDLTWQTEALQRRNFELIAPDDVPPELVDAVRTERGGAPASDIGDRSILQREV
jgi:GNAT superfamily N-acetyltransferase